VSQCLTPNTHTNTYNHIYTMDEWRYGLICTSNTKYKKLSQNKTRNGPPCSVSCSGL